jgi:uncharacterized protein (TIGR01777 family)
MKVLVSGATGFIGTQLCQHLRTEGCTVWGLSRSRRDAASTSGVDRYIQWQPTTEVLPAAALEGVDAVVHLAGESVAGRWSAAHRKAIEESRVVGTRNLVAGIADAAERPRVLVSSSAIGFYGDRGDEDLTETSDAGQADDFLVQVSQKWEAEARAAEELGVPVVRLRTGIVLGHGGGALKEMLLPAKLGLGGPLGSGRQWWSWIHMNDVVGIVRHALDQTDSTVWNNTAPVPVRQKEFAREMGRVLRRPAFAPAPAFALKLVLGGFANELLSSKKVLPTATQASGYEYQYPEIGPALADLLG